MKPISIPTCANKRSLPALLLCAGLLLPATAAAAENLGAHRTANPAEFQQVIEKKCIVCHTQQRIDIAIEARRNLEKIQQRMIERGADLSERDKSVLGTFWGSPLQEAPEKKDKR